MEGSEKEEEEKGKETGFADASKESLPFSHFHHLLCIFSFFHLPRDIFFFQSSNPPHILFSSISLR